MAGEARSPGAQLSEVGRKLSEHVRTYRACRPCAACVRDALGTSGGAGSGEVRLRADRGGRKHGPEVRRGRPELRAGSSPTRLGLSKHRCRRHPKSAPQHGWVPVGPVFAQIRTLVSRLRTSLGQPIQGQLGQLQARLEWYYPLRTRIARAEERATALWRKAEKARAAAEAADAEATQRRRQRRLACRLRMLRLRRPRRPCVGSGRRGSTKSPPRSRTWR